MLISTITKPKHSSKEYTSKGKPKVDKSQSTRSRGNTTPAKMTDTNNNRKHSCETLKKAIKNGLKTALKNEMHNPQSEVYTRQGRNRLGI